MRKSINLLFQKKKKIVPVFSFSASDWIICFFQILIYLVVSRPIRFFFGARRIVSKTLNKLTNGSLIIANHQSVLDPFIILSHLPFKVYLKIIPVRFPTSHKYFTRLRFLALFGAYDIGSNSRERMLGLMRTREYLLESKSIMIFPEGRICSHENMLSFQKGITFLTDAAQVVLFVRMSGFYYKNWLKKKQIEKSLVFSEVECYNGKQKRIEYLRQQLRKISA